MSRNTTIRSKRDDAGIFEKIYIPDMIDCTALPCCIFREKDIVIFRKFNYSFFRYIIYCTSMLCGILRKGNLNIFVHIYVSLYMNCRRKTNERNEIVVSQSNFSGTVGMIPNGMLITGSCTSR